MDNESVAVENFPLSISSVRQDYTRLPNDATNVLYHYTSKAGLAGILRDGGLRATYRRHMNDGGEFTYAKNVLCNALSVIETNSPNPDVATSLAKYVGINLDNLHTDSRKFSSSYCACLSVRHSLTEQWNRYAEEGRGFAIGFNVLRFLNSQRGCVERGEPYLFCLPVTYDRGKQENLPYRFIQAGLDDMENASHNLRSSDSASRTALRDRIMKDITTELLVLVNSIKSPDFSSEREIRLMHDPNDGTLLAKDIRYYMRDREQIPYLFFDLRSPITGRIPISSIHVGPDACFSEGLEYIEGLLDEVGYGSIYKDRPNIEHAQCRPSV